MESRITSSTQVTLDFSGPLATGGQVPFTLLAQKLQALQKVLNNVGTVLVGGGRRGQWRSGVTQACELRFKSVHLNSLHVVGDLAAPTGLAPEFSDLGLKSLGLFQQTVEALAAEDTAALIRAIPDSVQRNRVLKSLVPLIPDDDADYDFGLSVGVKKFAFSPKLRITIDEISSQSYELSSDAIRTLTGFLYRIQVGVGEREVGVLVSNRQIRCYYPQEFEDAVKDLSAGSLVEVEGLATLDARGEVEQIRQITNIRSKDLVPFHWKRIATADQEFVLHDTIQVNSDYRDDLWILEYEPLKIVAYASTRAESLRNFREEFAAIWHYVSDEEDEALTADAIQLRDTIRALVKEVRPTQ